jgi:hypothetical protein
MRQYMRRLSFSSAATGLFNIAEGMKSFKPARSPKSTTLFRNPAAGANITAFTMSHLVKDIVCLTQA